MVIRKVACSRLASTSPVLWAWMGSLGVCYCSLRRTRPHAEVVLDDQTALRCDRETNSSATIVETTVWPCQLKL